MKYLLDTCIVSEVRRGSRAPTDWLEAINPRDGFLSVTTLGEIERGIAMLARRGLAAAAELASWLWDMTVEFGERVLPVTVEVALAWGRLSARAPVPCSTPSSPPPRWFTIWCSSPATCATSRTPAFGS